MKKSMLNLYLLLLLLIGATNVFGDHSLSFDGVNDYVDINSLVGTALTDFTYSGWYKTNGPNGDEQPIINTQNGQVTINTEQTTLYAAAYSQRNGVSPRYRVETTSNVPANEWHHFAFTAGANTYKLYIDGVLIDDSEVEEPHNSIYANSEIGAHGRSNGSNTSFFNA